jgi:hypothetical protein
MTDRHSVLRSMKVVVALGLVGAIVAFVLKLAAAPLYQRYDARQCREAYANARTRTDTVAADLHPYGARHESRNRRCGELRGVPPAAVNDTLVLGSR